MKTVQTNVTVNIYLYTKFQFQLSFLFLNFCYFLTNDELRKSSSLGLSDQRTQRRTRHRTRYRTVRWAICRAVRRTVHQTSYRPDDGVIGIVYRPASSVRATI